MTCDAANLNAYSLSEQQYDGCSRIVGQELSSLEKEDLKSHAAKANSPFSVNVNLYEGQKVFYTCFASLLNLLILTKIFSYFLLYL